MENRSNIKENHMSIRFLKVKVKSLAAEAAIIRLEECRSHGELRQQLRSHRQREVRSEQRATQLAYGYLRGKSRAMIEPGAKSEPDWVKVQRMCVKYGDASNFEAWKAAV
jgi:hypothetical protein